MSVQQIFFFLFVTFFLFRGYYKAKRIATNTTTNEAIARTASLLTDVDGVCAPGAGVPVGVPVVGVPVGVEPGGGTLGSWLGCTVEVPLSRRAVAK